MNEWEKNRRMAESYRQSYPPGTRLELIGMDDPFAPIPAGMRVNSLNVPADSGLQCLQTFANIHRIGDFPRLYH